MTDIPIPPDAVEAALLIHHTGKHRTSEEAMIAALRAALSAWPGMHMEDKDTPWPPRIILPFPQEARDE